MGHKEPLDDDAMPSETDRELIHLLDRVDYLVTNIRLLPPTADSTIVLWNLYRGGQRLTCSVRMTPHGPRLQQSLDGDPPFFERTFATFHELVAWDEEDHEQCLSEGWTWYEDLGHHQLRWPWTVQR